MPGGTEESQPDPQKAWIQGLLQAARTDIAGVLGSENLAARDFGTVIRVSKMAEEIASCEGQPYLLVTCQRIVAECEFEAKAKNLFAALVAHFMGSDRLLYEKYRRLHGTHAQVEAARKALEAGQQHLETQKQRLELDRQLLETDREALIQMREALRLQSGDASLPNMPSLPALSEVLGKDGDEEA